MTAPDPAPTGEDILVRAMCDALVESPPDEPCEGCKVQAAAVVAAVRGMSPEQIGELAREALADAWHNGWVAGCNDQQYGDENAEPWTPNPWRAEP